MPNPAAKIFLSNKSLIGLVALITVVVFVGLLLQRTELFEDGTVAAAGGAALLTSDSIPTMGGGAQLYNRPCVIPLSADQIRHYQNTDLPLPINLANKPKLPPGWKQFYNTASGFGTHSCMLPADDYDVTADASGCSETNPNLFNPEIVAKVFPLTDNAQNRCVVHFKPSVADDQMHNYVAALKSVRDGREKPSNDNLYIARLTSAYASNKTFQVQNYAQLYDRAHTDFNMTFTTWIRITQRDGKKWSHVFGTSDNSPYMRAPALWIHPDKPKLQMTISRLQNDQVIHDLPQMTPETANTLAEPRTHWRNWMFMHHSVKAAPGGRHLVSTTVYTFDVLGNQIHVTPPMVDEVDDLLLSNQKRKAAGIDGDVERQYLFNRAQWWNNGRGFQVHDVRVSPTLFQTQQDLDTIIKSGITDLSMETEATGGRVMPMAYAIQTTPSPDGQDSITMSSYSSTDWAQNYDIMRDIIEGLLIPNPLYNAALPENGTDNVKYYVKRVKFIAYLGVLYEITGTTPANATFDDSPATSAASIAAIQLSNVSDPSAGVPQALTHGKDVKVVLGFVERPRLPLQIPNTLDMQI